MHPNHLWPYLGADHGMDFLSQVIDSIRVKWQKAQVRKDNLAVSTGCGSLVGGQIKHTRQEPQLSCDIIGIDRVKRVCKETFGRLEIAESQNEANLIGRCAGRWSGEKKGFARGRRTAVVVCL